MNLVERLRAEHEAAFGSLECSTYKEAARIEALEAMHTKLNLECDELREDNKRLAGEVEELKEIIAIKSDNFMENHAKHLSCLKQLASAQAENLKLREALREAMEWNWLDDDCGNIPVKEDLVGLLATPSDTTALTEYRNGVIEECAALLDKMDSQYFDGYEFRHVLPEDCAEDLRAMEEKP